MDLFFFFFYLNTNSFCVCVKISVPIHVHNILETILHRLCIKFKKHEILYLRHIFVLLCQK